MSGIAAGEAGPALVLGTRALADQAWQASTRARLARDVRRLVSLGNKAGWGLVGEASLFATFSCPDATRVQDHLARSRIWSRIFPYSNEWLRLGLPGSEDGWARLAAAIATVQGDR